MMPNLQVTDAQLAEYEKLGTVAERAKYLLQFEIESHLNLDPPTISVVNQAFAGGFALPIFGGRDEDVIREARAWLEERAQQETG